MLGMNADTSKPEPTQAPAVTIVGADTLEQDAGPDRYDELESILDDLRTRAPDTPQWEFCEGFMAALLCCRRTIGPDEYLSPLLGHDAGTDGAGELPDDVLSIPFADDGQRLRFMQLWQERSREVHAALEADVQTLDDEAAYHPQLFDMRGLVARFGEAERADIDTADLPAFAQLWALGFMSVVEHWDADWMPPRDRETSALITEALVAIDELSDDDTATPDVSPFDDADPPSVSGQRFDAFGAALWAVYDLYAVWQSLGRRIDPVLKADTPGRNDPCPCGSGRKYKKCHGA